MKHMIRAVVALLACGSAAFGSVTFTGRIDGPNDIDNYSLTASSGDFTAYVDLTSAASADVYVGLYSGDRLLAVTGPTEDLFANGPGGLYRLVVTSDGVADYKITVPGGTTVPEPASLAGVGVGAYLLSRRHRK